MEQHTLGGGFYTVTVGVCSTNRICYDPITRTMEVPAQLIDGRECIYPPGLKGGLYPGLWRGMWIIKPLHARKQEAYNGLHT